ncbi:MAG: nitrous oxide-stimulated promoter family protein [Desulfobulbaceae bacterium]|nr:MAG: nitrous oxide-stimulated promoter family protein [Desulfobulbaceae bacterium]
MNQKRQPVIESKRLSRDKHTIEAMINIYCRNHHHGESLCEECQKLQKYAHARLAGCPFNEQKPTCNNCPIHCYNKNMRAHIKDVMKYAGPRMFFYHPILAFKHFLDGFNKPPEIYSHKSLGTRKQEEIDQ